MDSVTQLALGAAVSVAVMGRRTAVWKAAAWGALAGTLPDLDVLIDHGDPVRNMVLHRGWTHAPFWETLVSLPLALLAARVAGELPQWRRWWLALWLAIVTHPLLDAMTVYGTRLALPFSDHPYGVGSIFIIDPLYTLPLLAGTGWALATRRLRANAAGLLLSTLYLGWSVFAQAQVERVARASLAAEGIAAEHVLVTPAPLNTVLWRVVAIAGDRYHEGFRSLLDDGERMHFDAFPRGAALAGALHDVEAAQRIMAFSKGFYALAQQGSTITISDLRMGQEPVYVFTFAVAEAQSAPRALLPPRQIGARPEIGPALRWMWRRAHDETVPTPR
jgi:inner membrane protein